MNDHWLSKESCDLMLKKLIFLFSDWRPHETQYSNYIHGHWRSPYYEDVTERQIQTDPLFDLSVAERVS